MVTSEGLESFGGQGYIEDTGLPGIMRDAQVQYMEYQRWGGVGSVMHCINVLWCEGLVFIIFFKPSLCYSVIL